MSEKGPFEAAIGVLQKELRYWPDWRERFESCETAIKILEAAGKIDKAELMVYLNHAIDWKENDPYGPGSAEEDRKLRTFIESLPEPGEERK